MSQATNYSLIYRGLKANFMLGFIDCNQLLFLAEHMPSLYFFCKAEPSSALVYNHRKSGRYIKW
ncbi:MAG: hypothetical protein ACOY9Y_09380, partial [Bacillota bacterium]